MTLPGCTERRGAAVRTRARVARVRQGHWLGACAGLLLSCCAAQLGTGAGAAPAKGSAPAVAVLDFEIVGDTNGVLTWASRGLADLLTLDLQGLGASTVDRTLVHAVLAELDLQAAGRTAVGSLAGGRLAGARYVIKGQASNGSDLETRK